MRRQSEQTRRFHAAEDLLQDIRFTVRSWRQKPSFAAVAMLTLALGIGATTVMFTVFSGVLLKPLPYPQPDRLVVLNEQTKGRASFIWGDLWAFSYPNFLDCKRETRSLDMAAWRWNRGTVTERNESEYVEGVQASSNLFSILGVEPAQGRAFLPDEDTPGARPVAIIGWDLWRRRFGGSPAVLGMPLVFDGKPYTVVGVAPSNLRLVDDVADLFTPLGQDTSPPMRDRGSHPGLNVFARLMPRASIQQAQAELNLIGRHLAEQYPKSNEDRGFLAEPLRPDVGDVRPTLWLLLGAVGLVLLIACVNIAALLLARSLSRERELAVRLALGAGRWRLARQCLTESSALGLAGGALGTIVSAFGVRPFVLFWPGGLPRLEEIRLDWRVLLFALAVSLLSGLLFGLAPALRVPFRDLEQTLRAGARTVAGSSRRLQGSFVIAEIALAVILLISAGTLGRTLLRLSSLSPGLNVQNVLVARVALSPVVLTNPQRIRTAWQDLLNQARRVPGVQSVAVVDTVPMREGNNQLSYSTTPAEPSPDRQSFALASSVTPDYLRTMGIPLLQGRFFTDRDRLGSEPVIVIDDVLAKHAFSGGEPVGQRIWISDMAPGPFRVVGVVGHVRHWGLAGDDQAKVRAQFYYPFAQVPDALVRRWSELSSIAVRTGVPPLSIIEPLRRVVRGATGDQVLYEVRTMDELAHASLARQRLLLLLFAIFAALALLLACIGIYGVLSYVIGRRVPEIGVRMALGATGVEVMRQVFGRSLAMIAAGTLLGAAGALFAARLMERFVVGVQPPDPWTFAVMIAVLSAAALLATFVPARRASHVDPIRALRQE